MAVRPPRPPEVPRSRAVGCKSPAYDVDEKSPTAWNKMDRMERVVSGKRCGCNGVGLPPLPGSHPNWQKSPGTRREPYKAMKINASRPFLSLGLCPYASKSASDGRKTGKESGNDAEMGNGDRSAGGGCGIAVKL